MYAHEQRGLFRALGERGFLLLKHSWPFTVAEDKATRAAYARFFVEIMDANGQERKRSLEDDVRR
jgi:hypothetical protein